jgi:hypothetical protein
MVLSYGNSQKLKNELKKPGSGKVPVVSPNPPTPNPRPSPKPKFPLPGGGFSPHLPGWEVWDRGRAQTHIYCGHSSDL